MSIHCPLLFLLVNRLGAQGPVEQDPANDIHHKSKGAILTISIGKTSHKNRNEKAEAENRERLFVPISIIGDTILSLHKIYKQRIKRRSA